MEAGTKPLKSVKEVIMCAISSCLSLRHFNKRKLFPTQESAEITALLYESVENMLMVPVTAAASCSCCHDTDDPFVDPKEMSNYRI